MIPLSLVTFLKEAIKHPREVSTAFPSSGALAEAMAEQVNFSNASLIVELGPGDGALTDSLVKRLDSGTELILLEINKNFCDRLRKKYRNHPKRDLITIIEDSAENLEEITNGRGRLDAVVSGLPLTSLPDDLSDKILTKIHSSLHGGGVYVQFTYLTMTFFNDFKYDIESVFRANPRGEIVWWNPLPAVVYSIHKEIS